MAMVSLCNRHGYIEVKLSTTNESETAGFVVKIKAAVVSRRKCLLKGRKKNRIVENLGDSGRGYDDVRLCSIQ